MTLDVRRLGRVAYEPTRALQHDLVERRARGEIPDTLLLCEHPPVVTLGRGARPDDVLRRDVPIVAIERGGEATYHGPGQLVGYWIRALPPDDRDLRGHLRALEGVLIEALAEFEVEGLRVPEATGVWVRVEGRDRKIASIGVAARRWVTYHGFALNVAVDLDGFTAVRPCGYDASVMTSLDLLRRPAPRFEAVVDAVHAAALRSVDR